MTEPTNLYQVYMFGWLKEKHVAPDGVRETYYKSRPGKRFMTKDYYALLPWIHPTLRAFWSVFHVNLIARETETAWHETSTLGFTKLSYQTTNVEGEKRMISAWLDFREVPAPYVVIKLYESEMRMYNGIAYDDWSPCKTIHTCRYDSPLDDITGCAVAAAEMVNDHLGCPHE